MTGWSDPVLKVERKSARGSDCSGSDGDKNRVLTLDNTSLSKSETVFVNGAILYPDQDYTISHQAANTQITFLAPVWDDMFILVIYFVGQ